MTVSAQSARGDAFGDLDFGDLDFGDDDLAASRPAIAPEAGPQAKPELKAVDTRADANQKVLILIDQMVVVFKDPSRPDLERLPKLHDLSNQLYLVADTLHLKVLTRAALLLHTVTERLRLARRWDPTSVAVFIEAFRRIHAAADDSPLADRILQGLRRVADRANPYAIS